MKITRVMLVLVGAVEVSRSRGDRSDPAVGTDADAGGESGRKPSLQGAATAVARVNRGLTSQTVLPPPPPASATPTAVSTGSTAGLGAETAIVPYGDLQVSGNRDQFASGLKLNPIASAFMNQSSKRVLTAQSVAHGALGDSTQDAPRQIVPYVKPQVASVVELIPVNQRVNGNGVQWKSNGQLVLGGNVAQVIEFLGTRSDEQVAAIADDIVKYSGLSDANKIQFDQVWRPALRNAGQGSNAVKLAALLDTRLAVQSAGNGVLTTKSGVSTSNRGLSGATVGSLSTKTNELMAETPGNRVLAITNDPPAEPVALSSNQATIAATTPPASVLWKSSSPLTNLREGVFPFAFGKQVTLFVVAGKDRATAATYLSGTAEPQNNFYCVTYKEQSALCSEVTAREEAPHRKEFVRKTMSHGLEVCEAKNGELDESHREILSMMWNAAKCEDMESFDFAIQQGGVKRKCLLELKSLLKACDLRSGEYVVRELPTSRPTLQIVEVLKGDAVEFLGYSGHTEYTDNVDGNQYQFFRSSTANAFERVAANTETRNTLQKSGAGSKVDSKIFVKTPGGQMLKSCSDDAQSEVVYTLLKSFYLQAVESQIPGSGHVKLVSFRPLGDPEGVLFFKKEDGAVTMVGPLRAKATKGEGVKTLSDLVKKDVDGIVAKLEKMGCTKGKNGLIDELKKNQFYPGVQKVLATVSKQAEKTTASLKKGISNKYEAAKKLFGFSK